MAEQMRQIRNRLVNNFSLDRGKIRLEDVKTAAQVAKQVKDDQRATEAEKGKQES